MSKYYLPPARDPNFVLFILLAVFEICQNIIDIQTSEWSERVNG